MHPISVDGQERERGGIVVQSFSHRLKSRKNRPAAKIARLINPIDGDRRTGVNNENGYFALHPISCGNGIEEPINADSMGLLNQHHFDWQRLAILNQGSLFTSFSEPISDSFG